MRSAGLTDYTRLPYEGEQEVANLEAYRGKTVLEVGSGWGCNLVRLATVAERAVGLEIEPVYLEFSGILAKREGVKPPEVILGAGESAPFADAEFDRVLLQHHEDDGVLVSARVGC